MPQLEADECLEHGHPTAGPCRGPVAFHSIGASLRAFPRCDAHAERAWERHENSAARWAHSDLPPAGWDPLDAGERWADDY